MLHNFSFVIDRVLAGMEHPGAAAALREHLGYLRRQGVGAIVSLTQEPLPKEPLQELGFRYLHLPVPDLDAPRLEQIREFVAFQRQSEADGLGVVVHCGAGLGRTGTFLACALVTRGLSPDEAIREVRRRRPFSIETPMQEDLVRSFGQTVGRAEHGG